MRSITAWKPWKLGLIGIWGVALTLGLLADPADAQGRRTGGPAWEEVQLSTTSDTRTTLISFHPRVAVDQRRSSGEFFVVWSQPPPGSQNTQDREIFLAAFSRRERTPRVINLSNSPGVLSDFPDIWIEGRNVYVVWEEGEDEDKEILFTASHDGGDNFEQPINISNTASREDRDPRVIAGSSNIVLVVWEQIVDPGQDSDIFFSFSRDGGKSFESSLRNLSSTSGTLSTFPQVARSSSGTFFVAWEDEVFASTRRGSSGGNTEIFFTSLQLTQGRQSTTGRRLNVSNSRDVNSLFPVLAASSRKVFLAWEEGGNDDVDREDREARFFDDTQQNRRTSTGEEREIFFTVSNDDGQSFEPIMNLSNSPQIDSRRPALATSQSRTLYVAWEEEEAEIDPTTEEKTTTDATDILLTKSEDGGVTFLETPMNLSNSLGADSRHASIAVNNRKVFVAWQEDIASSSRSSDEGSEILFARSTDAGDEFNIAQNLSRSLSNASQHPSVVGDSSTVFVLWEEAQSRNRRSSSNQGMQLLGARNEFDGSPFSTRFGRRVRARAVQAGLPTPVSVSVEAEETAPQPEGLTRAGALAVSTAREAAAWRFLVRVPSGTERVRLTVYDLAGRTIFADEVDARGAAQAVNLRWSLRDRAGRPVAGGIYLYRIEARTSEGEPLEATVRKLVVLR